MNTYQIGLGGYALTQMTNQSPSQMMGYLLTCPDGTLIVIDGGTEHEAPRLRQLIAERGNHVSLWLLTHCHSDHVTAPVCIFERPDGIAVDRLCCSFPSHDWLFRLPNRFSYEVVDRYAALGDRLPPIVAAAKGLSLTCGGVRIDCLTDPLRITREPLDPENFYINDTSAVYRLTMPNGKILLFTGDIGPGASDRLADEQGDALRADVCQMAHHGQNGASERFYGFVRPSMCLWDSPDWLYENDAGHGFDTGPWSTVRTRAWMGRLGVLRQVALADGEHTIV